MHWKKKSVYNSAQNSTNDFAFLKEDDFQVE